MTPRDMENAKKLSEEWKKKNYTRIGWKVRKESQLAESFKKECEKQGISEAEFAKQALTEKLIRDGYLRKE